MHLPLQPARWCVPLQVDAVFYGHEHMYQRTCPVYKGVCQPPLAAFNTGTLNALNTNTTSTYYNATAPVYYMAGRVTHRMRNAVNCRQIPLEGQF